MEVRKGFDGSMYASVGGWDIGIESVRIEFRVELRSGKLEATGLRLGFRWE